MSDFDKELDTSGLNCPLPIIKAKKGMRTQLLQFLKFKNEFVNLSVFKCSERSINTIKFWTPI